MSIVINGLHIPESQAKILRDTYVKIYKEFMDKHGHILNEWEEMKPILMALSIIENPIKKVLKSDTPTVNNNESRYESLKSLMYSYMELVESYDASKWSWFMKCKYILTAAGQGLTSNEIMDLIIDVFEPTLSKERLLNSIPATLSVASKEGRLVRNKKTNGEYEYILRKQKSENTIFTIVG